MRVFFCAGEASGDAYAAALALRLGALAPGIELEGVGSRRSEEAGIRLVSDSSSYGVVSITQSARAFFRIYAGLARARKAMLGGPPGLFIPIDFGFANVRMARFARGHGWKVLYFMPPGSWRKDRQGRDLPSVTDAVVTPFPWSATMLSQMGANAHFFGHPLRQLVLEGSRAGAVKGQTIAVLPGSRKHELRENLPAIAGAMERFPERVCEFALAPNLSAEGIRAAWKQMARSREGDLFFSDDRYGVMQRAEAGVICSGTATLEAVLCDCPMVVIYRVSALMKLEGELLRMRPKFAALPNILLDRRAVPELIQETCTPEGIARELAEVLAGPGAAEQRKAFAEIHEMLGPADALDRTAELAASMVPR